MNDLDAKVAKVLGWFISPGVGGPMWHRPGDVRSWPEPQFSTDYALLPDMLAWLKERAPEHCSLALTLSQSGWLAAIEEFADFDEGMDIVASAAAPTLPEAVARLVVAVAEAKL